MKQKFKWKDILAMAIYLVTLSTIIAFLFQAMRAIF